MLLNLIYLLSALVAVGLLLLTEGGIGLALAGFVGCFLLSLLVCFLTVWVAAKRTDPEKEHTQDDPIIRAIIIRNRFRLERSLLSWQIQLPRRASGRVTTYLTSVSTSSSTRSTSS